MRVTVLAFANVRELMGAASQSLELPGTSATVGAAWDVLAGAVPSLRALEGSTRLAVNGQLVERSAPLGEGDELAIMPPFGGG